MSTPIQQVTLCLRLLENHINSVYFSCESEKQFGQFDYLLSLQNSLITCLQDVPSLSLLHAFHQTQTKIFQTLSCERISAVK